MIHRLWIVVLGTALVLLLLSIAMVMAQKPVLRDNSNDPFSPDGNPESHSIAGRTAHAYTTVVTTTVTTVTTDPHPIDSDGQAAVTAVAPSVCRALIIVSGRMQEDDPLQDNIHNVTNAVYDLFRTYGYPSEQIFYLATDSTLDADGDGQPDVDDPPSDANLAYAITQWAVGKVGLDRCLTLYLMGYGGFELFYLDNTVGEVLTPEELDGWLDDLEAAVPGLETNVVMDSVRAGSFIDSPQSVSGPNRVIIASTSNTGLAYASQDGAVFSDAFIAVLGPDVNLQTAFDEARSVTEQAHADQTPWLDDDGDGVANEAHDGQVASQRYLLSTGASSVAISGPTACIVQVGYAFTATVDPITATLPITYVWQATEQTPLMHKGGVSHTATFSWTLAGVKIITVTASNRWVSVSKTHEIIVSALPNQEPFTPSDPTPVNGAGDVSINQVLSWHGGDPDGDPVTYTVALGTSAPPPVVARNLTISTYDPGTLVSDSAYYWGVTATDGLSTSAGSTWTFTTSSCPKPLAGLTLLGPTQGYTETAYTFTTFITPTDATPPIDYTWTPAPTAGQETSAASFIWDTPGTYAVNVAIANCSATLNDSRSVEIKPLPPPVTGDAYEEDDLCDQASTILTDGSGQIHTFHDHGDVDWVALTTTLGMTYAIEVRVPPTSTADVQLELYNACDGTGHEQDPAFSPDIRLVFQAPSDGPIFLKLSNDYPIIYGAQATYHISVLETRRTPPGGALVIVAGRLKANDELQANIHNVTNAVYRLARDNGCAPEQIHYLATDSELDADSDGQPDVDGPANKAELENVITDRVSNTIESDQPFTLYLMDHGGYDAFYLDGTMGEVLTPTMLSGWLDPLDAKGAQVNVIVEACHSGSFIDQVKTVSKSGRTVIASTGPDALAYATQEGALFSDALLNALDQAMSLRTAFEEGLWAAGQAHPDQTPWLDANGNGVPNESADMETATGRVFSCAAVGPETEAYPPQITQVDVTGLERSTSEIWAQVNDDTGVQKVWAVVYAPSDQPPESSGVFEAEPNPIELQPRGEGWYYNPYAGFDESGEYRVVVYAQDVDELEARPREHKVQVPRVYLPLVLRGR